MKFQKVIRTGRGLVFLGVWLVVFSAMSESDTAKDKPVTIRPQRARGVGGELLYPGLMRGDPTMDHLRRILDHFRPERGTLITLPSIRGEDRESRVVSHGRHRVTASSFGRWKHVVYAPDNAFDQDYRTAWVEGKRGHGIGEWLELQFRSRFEDGEHMEHAFRKQAVMRPRLAGLVIISGYAKKPSMYRNNNRPRRLDARLSWNDAGGFRCTRSYHLLLDDARRPQVFLLPEPVLVFGQVRLRLTIRSLYRGARFPDTCIAEVCLFFTDGPTKPQKGESG